jgi:hypothetical protein
MTLTEIDKITIPRKVLNKTFSFLRQHGKRHHESHALLVGKGNKNTFEVSDVWFPMQHNTSISFTVPEEEVHRINVKLNELQLTTIAQIHTHPSTAFHSPTDNEGAEVVLPGSFSIVIPDFGFIAEDDFDEWEVFRFDGIDWPPISKSEVKQIFKII